MALTDSSNHGPRCVWRSHLGVRGRSGVSASDATVGVWTPYRQPAEVPFTPDLTEKAVPGSCPVRHIRAPHGKARDCADPHHLAIVEMVGEGRQLVTLLVFREPRVDPGRQGRATSRS